MTTATTNESGLIATNDQPAENTTNKVFIVGQPAENCNSGRLQAEASALTLQLIRDIATGNENRSVARNETKQAKGGRPRKHADTAARQAAYRARNAGMLVNWRIDKHTVNEINEFARVADMSATELANQMLKLALSNRNWKLTPMFGKPLPNAQHVPKKNKGDGQ